MIPRINSSVQWCSGVVHAYGGNVVQLGSVCVGLWICVNTHNRHGWMNGWIRVNRMCTY